MVVCYVYIYVERAVPFNMVKNQRSRMELTHVKYSI